jgi:outer membrane receptor protein involved in Fe transport
LLISLTFAILPMNYTFKKLNMNKNFRYLALTIGAGLLSFFSIAQQIVIKGNVKNTTNKETLGGINVEVKNTTRGSYSDANGNFSITVPGLPVTLVFTAVNFETQEIVVDSKAFLEVSLKPSVALGTEIVISASRLPQRILESPVTIERVGAAAIKNASASSYYDVIQNLKGVDLMTSSLTFKTPTTRGFNGSGNTRFTQLMDGMDNQAPGLNFSVGGFVGMPELDVDNIELLPGASSALYGPGGMNGTLLISSKNPFKNQGLSFLVKTGILHTDKYERSQPSAYYNWGLRWAKKVSDKFAFKITTEIIKANDWVANDKRNYLRNGTDGKLIPGTRATDPNYDGVNVYGDETTIAFKDLMNGIGAQAPFLQPYINQLIAANPGLGISRTGYNESEIISPITLNYKLGGSLNYKLSNNTEAVLLGYWGTGSSVYTGSERYSLKNLFMGQYKLEINNKKWFLRAFTTQENSGESFNATVAARLTTELLSPSPAWYPVYGQTFLGAKLSGLSDADAHTAARAAADAGRVAANSQQYRDAFKIVTNKPIGNDPIKQGGAKFLDRTDLYNYEGQYNFSEYTKSFADILVGGNVKRYVLNSKGTLFADSAGSIGINEFGAYVQASKGFMEDKLKLIVSGRYDKNQNFKGKFTPRATATYKVSENGTIRASFQTAYRFPSTQQQWISLDIGSNVRLLGGVQDLKDFYKFATNSVYTLASVTAGSPVKASFNDFKPESVTSFEVGYKGLHVAKKLLFDVYGYYGQYQDFIVRTLVAQPKDGNVANIGNASNRQVFSVPTNSPSKVTTYGWGFGIEYRLPMNFGVSTNLSSDVLQNVPAGFVASFNSPKYRGNLTLSNNAFGFKKRFGFGLTYRFQDGYHYDGDFANGELPSVQTLDAQFSYRIPAAKSTFKIGANNLLNQYYRTGFGNPMIGGLYYVSYGYNF